MRPIDQILDAPKEPPKIEQIPIEKVKVPTSKVYRWESDTVTMKHLNEVRPMLKKLVIPILNRLEDKGWQPRVVEGLRTVAQERTHVANGTSKTMHSMHLIGKAVDIVDKRYGWDGKAASLDYGFWVDYGDIVDDLYGKSGQLHWGGDWVHFKDVAHVELPHTSGEFLTIDLDS